MKKYQAYESYKNSGVEWLGEIPSHWDLIRLKEFSKVIGGYPFDSEKFDPEKGTPLVRIRDINKTKTEVCFNGFIPDIAKIDTGDILIGMDGDFNVTEWKGNFAVLNQRVACVRCDSSDLQRFFFYALPFNMKVVNDLTYYTTVKHLSIHDIEKTMVGLPSEQEIKKIANFLDYETAKIDDLIAKQVRLIELLKEKRQAVISHAVTKGLDPNAPMKDSGIEWLGEIPKHWDVWKMSHLYDFIGSGTTPPTNDEKNFEGIIPWITTGELRENIIYDTKSKLSEKAFHKYSTLKLYPKGSLAIAMYGATIGRLGLLGIEATTNQACCVFSSSKIIDNQFLFYWFQGYKNHIINLSSGGGQPNINQEKLSALKIGLPNISIQRHIIEHLDFETAKIDKLVLKAKKMIEMSKERRTALISSAVTGKIDVRHWQAQPNFNQ